MHYRNFLLTVKMQNIPPLNTYTHTKKKASCFLSNTAYKLVMKQKFLTLKAESNSIDIRSLSKGKRSQANSSIKVKLPKTPRFCKEKMTIFNCRCCFLTFKYCA
jgi:hypothetical protein